VRLRTLLILIAGALALVLIWIIKGRPHSAQSVHSSQATTEHGTPTMSPLVKNLQSVIKPASTPDTTQEKAKASAQFGEALERAGIETQAGPSK